MKTQLKKLRKNAGYRTQQDMADALKVPYTRYADWERGDTEMSLSTAFQITELLQCTLDELVGRTPPPANYTDPNQRALNACYENMNDEGKRTLMKVARSLEYDVENRAVKNRAESNDDSQQLAG